MGTHTRWVELISDILVGGASEEGEGGEAWEVGEGSGEASRRAEALPRPLGAAVGVVSNGAPPLNSHSPIAVKPRPTFGGIAVGVAPVGGVWR